MEAKGLRLPSVTWLGRKDGVSGPGLGGVDIVMAAPGLCSLPVLLGSPGIPFLSFRGSPAAFALSIPKLVSVEHCPMRCSEGS